MNISDLLKKPWAAGLLGVIVGLAIGLLVGWVLWPVEWTDADPSFLRSDLQEDYLRMVIDSYAYNWDEGLALRRYQALGADGPAVLQKVGETYPDRAALQEFMMLVPAAGAATPPAGGGGGRSPIGNALLIVGIVVVVGLVLFLAVRRFFRPLVSRGASRQPTAAMRARDITSQTAVTDYEAMGEEPPIAQFVTTYVLGDDLFDDSFSIDSPSGEFLGECGIGISETIGVGDPKKVQAFELWMFDKNDIQTVTKVLMSAHAYNDPATVQRLEAKGEPVLVERGRQIVMETAALQLVATVSDMEYGQGPLPEKSYFDRLTLEIAVWPKVTAPA